MREYPSLQGMVPLVGRGAPSELPWQVGASPTRPLRTVRLTIVGEETIAVPEMPKTPSAVTVVRSAAVAARRVVENCILMVVLCFVVYG